MNMGLIRTKRVSAPPKETDDFCLTRAVAQGDPDARRVLAHRLFDRVRATMSYIAKSTDAEDLAQNALIRILQSADSFRGEGSLESWADRISVRLALKHFEKRSRRLRLFESKWIDESWESQSPADTEQLYAKRRLSSLIRELSKHQAVAMVLHYVHGYKIDEIADITEAPINTVRGRLRNGRKRLKGKILSDPYLSDWVEGRE